MKKIVSLLIAVMMISTVAFGATINSATAEYKTITVNYSGVSSTDATVLVYQIDNEEGTPEFDSENHAIVGINQDKNNGTFEIRLSNADYSGALIVAIGGDGTVARYRIDVVGGVPDSVTTDIIDCEGGTLTLENGKQLTIGDSKLLDAYVSNVSGGTITYVNKNDVEVDLAGSIYFDAAGNITAAGDTPVTLTINGGSTKTVGFIWKATLNGTAGTYSYTVTDGSDDVSDSFSIPAGLIGTVRFAVGVTSVPEATELTLSAGGFVAE